MTFPDDLLLLSRLFRRLGWPFLDGRALLGRRIW